MCFQFNTIESCLFLNPVKLTRCIFNQLRPSGPSGFPLPNTKILRATSSPEIIYKSKSEQMINFKNVSQIDFVHCENKHLCTEFFAIKPATC